MAMRPFSKLFDHLFCNNLRQHFSFQLRERLTKSLILSTLYCFSKLRLIVPMSSVALSDACHSERSTGWRKNASLATARLKMTPQYIARNFAKW